MYSYIKENRKKVLLIPLILYWLTLFIGTTLPSDTLSTLLEFSDKLKHFIGYLGLAFLLSLNFHFQERWKNLAEKWLLAALLICLIYGLFDEIHQIYVPNRSAELLDWVADSLGSLVGIVFSYLTVKFLKNKNSLETI